ncbi:MAG: hypothetical protein ACKO6E_00645, partial [Planctomycetota bacterium]
MKSFADLLWTLVRWTLPLSVAAVVVAVVIGSNRVGEELRRRVEAKLAATYPDLAVSVQAASLVEGEGIALRGISIDDPAIQGEGRRLVAVEEVRIGCGTSLPELLSGEPVVTSVRLIRPVVRASRGPDGRWSLSRLTREAGDGLRIPVTVDDATLLLEGSGLGARLTLRSIAAELRPGDDATSGRRMAVRGSFAGDLFDRAGFEGWLAVDGSFAVTGKIDSLDVSPRSQALLPVAGGRPAWIAGLRGRLDLDWRVAGVLAELERADFAAAGRLEAGHFEHSALPFAITDVSAAFALDRGGVRCERLEAHSGSTLLRGSGRMVGWNAAADF